MKTSDAALKEAEEFVRKALAQFSEKPATEKDIKKAAEKISKAMPPEKPRKVA